MGGQGESGQWHHDEGKEARRDFGLRRLETNMKPVKLNMKSSLLSVR